MSTIDPMTKIGVMLAIRKMARDNDGVKDGAGALEWALHRGILKARPGFHLERGQDDLVLTVKGVQIVAAFWNQVDAKRLARGKGITLGGRG